MINASEFKAPDNELLDLMNLQKIIVIVAAGAVVTKDVAPYTIVGGVPAKFLKAVER